jgi:hypothetical protein
MFGLWGSEIAFIRLQSAFQKIASCLSTKIASLIIDGLQERFGYQIYALSFSLSQLNEA